MIRGQMSPSNIVPLSKPSAVSFRFPRNVPSGKKYYRSDFLQRTEKLLVLLFS